MKVKVPLLVLLLLAAAVGYLLGTEKGRRQRDQIVNKVLRREAIDELADAVEEAADDLAVDAQAAADQTDDAAGAAAD